MAVKVVGGSIEPCEEHEYLKYLRGKFPGRDFEDVTIELDGDFVNLSWTLKEQPFERIRRITGYLVGDKSRWNNAKSAEELDRVKHGVDE